MPRDNQFSLRSLFIWTTIVCCLIGGLMAYGRGMGEAQKAARRAAIRDGRIPPEVIDGVLVTPDQSAHQK